MVYELTQANEYNVRHGKLLVVEKNLLQNLFAENR